MWQQLERWTSVNAWEPASLAAHVLLALDSLLASLKSRHASHFILPDCNILCQTPLDLSLIAKYGDHVSLKFQITFNTLLWINLVSVFFNKLCDGLRNGLDSDKN